MKTFVKTAGLLIFSLILCIFILEISLRIIGYFYLPNVSRANVSKDNSFIISCFGDSYTQGADDNLNIGGYPTRLRQLLDRTFSYKKFDVINHGRGGNNSSQIVRDIKKILKEQRKPNLIIVLVGANNYWSFEEVDAARYKPLLGVKKYWLLKADIIASKFKVYKLAKIFLLNLKHKIKSFAVRPVEASEEGLEIFEEKLRFLEMTIEKEPLNYNAYIEMGQNYCRMGRGILAIDIFKKAIEIDPNSVEAYILLGENYRDIGEIELGEKILEEAIEMEPNNLRAYLALGNTYKHHKKYSLAIAIFRNILKANPALTSASIELADIYQRQKKYDVAISVLKEVLRINPSDYIASEMLIEIYELQNKKPLASEMRNRMKESEGMTLAKQILKNDLTEIYYITQTNDFRLILQNYPSHYVPYFFNETIREIADNFSIPLVDNSSIFMIKLRTGKFDDYFVGNGHCNAKGYDIIAENVFKVLFRESIE